MTVARLQHMSAKITWKLQWSGEAVRSAGQHITLFLCPCRCCRRLTSSQRAASRRAPRQQRPRRLRRTPRMCQPRHPATPYLPQLRVPPQWLHPPLQLRPPRPSQLPPHLRVQHFLHIHAILE